MAQVMSLSLRNANLSGPAFPAAWLQPGMLSRLERLQLSGNARLAGTLPANLSWPALNAL